MIGSRRLRQCKQLDKLRVAFNREMVLNGFQGPTGVVRIQGTGMAVWIYADEAHVVGPGIDLRLEKWDSRTPAVRWHSEDLLEVAVDSKVRVGRSEKSAGSVRVTYALSGSGV